MGKFLQGDFKLFNLNIAKRKGTVNAKSNNYVNEKGVEKEM